MILSPWNLLNYHIYAMIQNKHGFLGKIDYNLKESEKENIKFRRSLYFVENLKKGQILNEKSIKSVRPCYGISLKNILTN